MALSEQQMAQFLAAQQAQAREQILYEFNAGTMEMAGKTVTADPRKGKVVLSMEDDGLLRLQWRLRHSDNNEQQYFIFPAGATWTRVSECKDGRVFLLKFKDSSVRRFFWVQEPTSTAAKKDAEILRRVSALIANPPKFGAPLPKEDETAAAADDDVSMEDAAPTVAREMGDDVALQGRDHPGPSVAAAQAHRGAVISPHAIAAGAGSPAPAPAATPAAAPAVGAPPAAGTGAAAGAVNANSLLSTLNAMAQQLQARQEQEQAGAAVEDVLDPSRVQPILDVDSALVDALVEYLPEGQRSPAALRAQLRSPQLQQTMTRLTSILNSAQFGQLMASLSLPATGGLGVDAFLRAIQEQAQRQQQQGAGQGAGAGAAASSADKPKEQK